MQPRRGPWLAQNGRRQRAGARAGGRWVMRASSCRGGRQRGGGERGRRALEGDRVNGWGTLGKGWVEDKLSAPPTAVGCQGGMGRCWWRSSLLGYGHSIPLLHLCALSPDVCPSSSLRRPTIVLGWRMRLQDDDDEEGGRGSRWSDGEGDPCPSCGRRYNTSEFWIACDECDTWCVVQGSLGWG